MRIACLQFSPHVGDVNNNMTRAERVLAKANPHDLDLLVLPEMAFSGYNFKSLSEIHSSLEPTGSGVSGLWARTTALKYNCHVAVGYPEKADVTHKWPADPEYYNAAIMVGPEGDNVAHHRKAHLYYTDQTWALEGNKGFYGDHVTGLGQTAIGICMDINPYKFEADWYEFEFANHILHSDANLVVLSMAWLTLNNQAEFTSHPNEPDLDTLAYWTMRLEPLIRAESDDEIIVVFCNRCGTEGEALYVGTSAVLGIRGGEVNVYGYLGRCEKNLLVVDTNQAPIAKLVMMGREIRLVRTSSGAGGSPPQSALSYSSPIPGADEKRERGSSRNGASDRGPTPSNSKEPEPTKEPGTFPAAHDPSRQSLHRLAPVLPAQRGSPSLNPAQHSSPSLTPDTLRRGKHQPPKLSIPETGSRSWRKSGEAVTGPPGGPGHTPVRHKPRDPFEPQVTRPPSRQPDSAVVLSAVERSRNSIFSPADSGIGRNTPEPRHRRSSRRSGEHRSSRHKDALKLDTVLPEELTLEEEAARRAQTLKDSPVARRPDSSVLSHWLESLPKVADLEPLPGTSPTEPRPPSVGKEVVSGGCSVCHTCGQDLPKGHASGVGSKNEKKRISTVGTEGLGSKELESAGPREEKGSNGFPQPKTLQNGLVDLEARRFDRTKRGEAPGGALSLVEEGDEGGLQPQVFGADKAAERESREKQWMVLDEELPQPKVDDGSNGIIPGEANEGTHAAADNTAQQRRASPAEVNAADDKPTYPSDPLRSNGAGTEKKMEKPEQGGIQDALAPRARIVPPSVKGMEKVVAVAIRPTSVAW